MEYFVYGRDHPGVGDLRWERTGEHWTFMDSYADVLIARGPTLTDDGEGVTGSVHIVDLPGPEAARAFAYDEPYYRAGVFADVLVRRFSNTLGRTMWAYPGTGEDPRFLVLGHGRPGATAERDRLRADQRDHLAAGYADRLIAHGPLLSADGTDWLGTATLVELPDRAAAEAMLAHGPYAEAGLYERVEVHPWRFGGRPAS
ncbi:YciI family protein [Longispora sp. NPDC051575]|uniref:YciI family protein n=1 Tax=Longispora sp. NPDC051575 TaxID=3154943 RepID=UPI0034159839